MSVDNWKNGIIILWISSCCASENADLTIFCMVYGFIDIALKSDMQLSLPLFNEHVISFKKYE